MTKGENKSHGRERGIIDRGRIEFRDGNKRNYARNRPIWRNAVMISGRNNDRD